jgi:hypothetical protein
VAVAVAVAMSTVPQAALVAALEEVPYLQAELEQHFKEIKAVLLAHHTLPLTTDLVAAAEQLLLAHRARLQRQVVAPVWAYQYQEHSSIMQAAAAAEHQTLQVLADQAA